MASHSVPLGTLSCGAGQAAQNIATCLMFKNIVQHTTQNVIIIKSNLSKFYMILLPFEFFKNFAMTRLKCERNIGVKLQNIQVSTSYY